MQANRTRGAATIRRLALLLLAAAGAAAARVPEVAPDELVAARFEALALLPGGEGAAVALAVDPADADEPERVVAIFIGPVEAAAIARARDGNRPMRPLTHELLVDVLAASGLEARRLVIDQLRGGVYLATLEFVAADGAIRWVDARPSDGLVLALRLDLPILLGPTVVASAPDWDELSPADDPRATPPVSL